MSLAHKMAPGLACKDFFPLTPSIAKYADRVNKITERLNDLHVSSATAALELWDLTMAVGKYRVGEVFEIGDSRLEDGCR